MTAQTLLVLLGSCVLSQRDDSERTPNVHATSRASDVRRYGQRAGRVLEQAEEFVQAVPSERSDDESALHVDGDRVSDGGQRGHGLSRYLQDGDRSERERCDGNADACRGHTISARRDGTLHLQSARNR